LALTAILPDKPDEAMHEGKFVTAMRREQKRLRELTAQVSATYASTKRFMSVSRGWKSNTAPGLSGSWEMTARPTTRAPARLVV